MLLALFDVIVYPRLAGLPRMFSLWGSIFAMFCLAHLSKYTYVALSNVLEGERSWKKETVKRARDAHDSQWSVFYNFTFVVLLAMFFSDTSSSELFVLTNGFLYVRALYNLLCIIAFDGLLSILRDTVRFVGALIVFKIFLLSFWNILGVFTLFFAAVLASLNK